MEIKFNDAKTCGSLPAYVSTEAAAKFIGCGKRTVNRWLKKHPALGITVYSSSGKHARVLSRDDVKTMFAGMRKVQKERKKKNVTKRSNR
jgi:pyocin large subunit-like protein